MKPFSLLLFLALTVLSLAAQDTTRNEFTLSAFRKLRSSATLGKVFYLTDPGREGLFIRDQAGGNSTDDSVMLLRTADGILFRRLADQGLINVKWFGATGSGSTDDWHSIQKAINYILNENYASRTLYFPPGNYLITKPLLIASQDRSQSYSWQVVAGAWRSGVNNRSTRPKRHRSPSPCYPAPRSIHA